MRILSLDLGTSTGWAFWDGISEQAGAWELASEKNLRYAKKLRMDRRLDIRMSSLWNHLEEFNHNGFGADWIFFEDVKFAHSQAQSHLWASFRGIVWAFAYLRDLQIDCLDTGKLKKFASGSGAATKDQMAVAWVKKHSNRYRLEKNLVRDVFSEKFLNDDAIDALHLLDWAKHLLT